VPVAAGHGTGTGLRARRRGSVSTPKTNLFGLTKRLGEEGVGKGKGLCVYFGQGQTLSIATWQQQVAAPLSIVQARSIAQLEMDFEASCMGWSGSERIRRQLIGYVLDFSSRRPRRRYGDVHRGAGVGFD
jgi:hypothetical protein